MSAPALVDIVCGVCGGLAAQCAPPAPAAPVLCRACVEARDAVTTVSAERTRPTGQ